MGNTEKTYWAKNGKFQAESETQWAALVPVQGACATVEGEMIRASTKMYWDLYNNGFGNNWSGAWNFLYQYEDMLGIQEALRQLEDYKCGSRYAGRDKVLYESVETIADAVTAYVASLNGVYTPNEEDMYDYSEDDAPYEEDEGEDDYIYYDSKEDEEDENETA